MRKYLGEEFYTLYRASLDVMLKIVPLILGSVIFLSGAIQTEWAEEILVSQIFYLMIRAFIIGVIQGWLGTFIFVTLVFVLMKVLNVPTDIINGQIIKNLTAPRPRGKGHFSRTDCLFNMIGTCVLIFVF